MADHPLIWHEAIFAERGEYCHLPKVRWRGWVVGVEIKQERGCENRLRDKSQFTTHGNSLGAAAYAKLAVYLAGIPLHRSQTQDQVVSDRLVG